MSVTCLRCGAVSHDLEFCDQCNADLAPPAAAPPPAACRLSGEPALHLSNQQRSHLTRPEAAILVRGRRHPWRLHWIAGPDWPGWRERVLARAAARAAVLPAVRVVEEHAGTWVIAEATGKPAAPWTQPPA